MIGFLLKIVAKLRLLFEGFLFKLHAPKNWEKLPDIIDWKKAFLLSAEGFDKEINSLPYRWDRWKGFLDFSFPIEHPEYFFKELPFGRDCDDWARIWSAYCRYHGLVCEEWIVTTKNHPFTKSHFVSVVHENGKYRLLDYHRWDVCDTAEDAVKSVCGHWTTYTPENIVMARYRVWKP